MLTAMTVSFSALSEDELRMLSRQLCNALEPCVAVSYSSTCHGLRVLTQEDLQHLRARHEAATALCPKLGMRSCKELREAREVYQIFWHDRLFSAADLATLGSLGAVLPALEQLHVFEEYSDVEPARAVVVPNAVLRLAAGLGAGALPAMTVLELTNMHSCMGDAGALALAAALGRGALPRIKTLMLNNAAIRDAGLVALAPALRRLPALEQLYFTNNPLSDEGVSALVAPLPEADALSPPKSAVLPKLKVLYLRYTQITDAGCAALASALERRALPALERLGLDGIPASAVAKNAVYVRTSMSYRV